MENLKNTFDDGVDSSKLKTHKQAIIRAIVHGIFTALALFNNFHIWVKILIFIVLFLIYGMVASSKRFRNKL
jgi:1,4-dihydroxy-2-naphthoate octaprenyltransferase